MTFKVVAFAGYSGSGKTRLIEQLIPALKLRGLRVSVVKHAHHKFDIDHAGKDTWRHREAGAFEVVVASNRRLALVREQILQRSGQTWTDAEREAFKQPIRDEYERFADAYNFAANLWVDGVIDPLETRNALTLLLEAASRTPRQETRFGVSRM